MCRGKELRLHQLRVLGHKMDRDNALRCHGARKQYAGAKSHPTDVLRMNSVTSRGPAAASDYFKFVKSCLSSPAESRCCSGCACYACQCQCCCRGPA